MIPGTFFYAIFVQNGPPRAPEAAHGTHRCAELQMQKATSGKFTKHGAFPGHELDYGELWKIQQKYVFLCSFAIRHSPARGLGTHRAFAHRLKIVPTSGYSVFRWVPFLTKIPRRAVLKKNDIGKYAQFGGDAKRVHNASCIHSALFASGGAHFGFFSAQREQDEMYAVRVRGLFCVITDKTQNNTRYDF